MNSSSSFGITQLAITTVTNGTKEMPEQEYVPYSERPETYIMPIIMIFILVVGITGNGLLAYTILRHANMRSIPNTYVLSLAIGDLMLIVMNVPFTFIVYIVDSWPFGQGMCKMTEYIKDISIGVSVFTLTALSADRYFAIVNPMKKLNTIGGRKQRKYFNLTVAVLIWVLAMICAIPATFAWLKPFQVNKEVNFTACYPFPDEFGPYYPKVILLCRFCIYYVIPLIIIGVFYILMARHLMLSVHNIPCELQGQIKQVQARKKVAKMVMAFVIIFAICFFPHHVYTIWFYFHPTAQEDFNLFWHCFRMVGICLAFINSCINPIALYCVSGSFRKHFDRYLCCRARSRRQHRRSSDRSSRGYRKSISLGTRTNLSDSHQENRSLTSFSIMTENTRTFKPIKQQETIMLSTYPNIIGKSSENEKILIEPTACDRLVTL